MPYHNPQVELVIIVASGASFRFPADAYSPAVWDETLLPYAGAAGLVSVLLVPAGAVEAEINMTHNPAVVEVDVVPADVAAIVNGIAGGTTQAQLAVPLAAILARTPALGQALAGLCSPVVLTALQQVALTPPTAAAIAAAIVTNPPASLVAGIGAPQADLATAGTGLEVNVAIPAGAKFIDFFLDLKAYVAATDGAGAAFGVGIGTDTGAPYMPNLNFRIPCQGATHLHLKGSTAAINTLQWTVIS